MSIEHSRHEWGNWLSSVKAAKGPNVLQTNQSIADEASPTLTVEDLSHLVPPLEWTQSGIYASVGAGGAGTYARCEVRAVQPFWLTWFQPSLQSIKIYVIEAHLLATADVTPASVFGKAPRIRYRIGTTATAPTANTLTFIAAIAACDHYVFPGRGLFCPQGKVMVFDTSAANQAILVQALFTEVPHHRQSE